MNGHMFIKASKDGLLVATELSRVTEVNKAEILAAVGQAFGLSIKDCRNYLEALEQSNPEITVVSLG